METPTTQADPAADEHAHQNAVMKASLNEAGDTDQRLEEAAGLELDELGRQSTDEGARLHDKAYDFEALEQATKALPTVPWDFRNWHPEDRLWWISLTEKERDAVRHALNPWPEESEDPEEGMNEAGRLEWAALMDRAYEFLYGSGKWTAA